jgi:hypothetical protein
MTARKYLPRTTELDVNEGKIQNTVHIRHPFHCYQHYFCSKLNLPVTLHYFFLISSNCRVEIVISQIRKEKYRLNFKLWRQLNAKRFLEQSTIQHGCEFPGHTTDRHWNFYCTKCNAKMLEAGDTGTAFIILFNQILAQLKSFRLHFHRNFLVNCHSYLNAY